MNHREQRQWLIRQLLDEQPDYRNYSIPASEQEQKNMLRSLMNVRMPEAISKQFLEVQDEYLSEENSLSGITDCAELTPSEKDERLYLWQGDITALKIDAIVNACNCQLLGCFIPMHNCVDNIIHSKSGIQLRLKCNELMKAQGHEEPNGKAKITPAYNLPCKYVLHTVGPVVSGRLNKKHEEDLASCYNSCLELADQKDIESIAFCCISTGVFMFPNDRAAEIAVDTVTNYLDSHDTGIRQVVFNVFKDIDLNIYNNILK